MVRRLVLALLLVASTAWAQDPVVIPHDFTGRTTAPITEFVANWQAIADYLASHHALGSVSLTSVTVIGAGQVNNVNDYVGYAPSGSTQQIGFASTITGSSSALLAPGSFRIAGFFGAESRTGGESVMPLNISAIARASDPATTVHGVQMTIANNQASSALNCSTTCYDGWSIVSTGSGAASYGLTIGGNGQWQQAVEVDQGAVATGGYAFNYKGDGTNGAVRIHAEGSVAPGSVTFTNLTTALTANGLMVYCSDCKVTTGTPGNPSTYTNNTCTSGGNGALAIRLNGANVCYQ